ncbi:YqzE family protein [Bacillus solimangrovi]|uniref:YqzE family protein n=1 Tax=Bacillus solimangrovi TaxID=1305675 RepID=A0A1E5LFM3_9BACI|nr:YqzE family protein [Bacillus solimangrovi]OEH92879.1 YqzE family protein [Bacillus solimangrovi]
MSANDYVKFVTQQIVSYMDQPKEERKRLKNEKSQNRQPRMNRYFGMMPFAVSMMFNKKKKAE